MKLLSLFSIGILILQFINAGAIELNNNDLIIEKSFLRLSEGKVVSYEYHQNIKASKTLVLLNGLIYSAKNWEPFIETMRENYSILFISYSAHPESLVHLKENETPYFMEIDGTMPIYNVLFPIFSLSVDKPKGIDLMNDLVGELKAVIKHLNINTPMELMTLSFGGYVGSTVAKDLDALNLFERIILMAPGVKSLHLYEPLLAYTHNSYLNLGESGHNFLIHESRKRIRELMNSKQHDDDYAPSFVPFEWFREGAIELAISAFFLDLTRDIQSIPATGSPIDIIVATKEDPIELLYDQFLTWQSIPESRRGAFILIYNSEHDFPGSQPKMSSILYKKFESVFQKGLTQAMGRTFTFEESEDEKGSFYLYEVPVKKMIETMN